MGIYIDLFLVAVVTVYIVDISGFTGSWRDALARWLKVSNLRPLPPFDCGKCAAFWACVIYAICLGRLSLETVAFAAAMSLLSNPVGEFMIFIREWTVWILDKLMPRG